MLKGYAYADGVHWHYLGKEVAVINLRGEIEWCVRTHNLPEEVVAEVRKCVPRPDGVWKMEVRRIQHSETQGSIKIFVNGRDMDMNFADEYVLNKQGNYESAIPDSALGKFLFACLWHKLDAVYHYSERFKDIFYPDWREVETLAQEIRKEADE